MESPTTTTTALITGANKGIGYEIAAGLGALGWRVGVGARDEQRREEAVAKLREAGADAFGVPLDVTDDASVAAAAQLVHEQAGGLDVLVNNAGVTGGMPQTPTTVDLATVQVAVDTSVLGVIRVTNAMLPMLRRSASPRIVNMSSTVGSLTQQSTPGAETGPIAVAYSPSKSFLNAVTVQYAKELQDTGVLINAACPGFVGGFFDDAGVLVTGTSSCWRATPSTAPPERMYRPGCTAEAAGRTSVAAGPVMTWGPVARLRRPTPTPMSCHRAAAF